MITAEKVHKERVIALLAECVDTNKSINWIVRQDSKRKERIRHLIDYAFDTCVDAGQIYLTEEQNGVMICSMSDDKLPFIEEAWLTLRFIIQVTGIDGIRKALRREKYVTSFHPQDEEFIYIWFLAVDKAVAGHGIGSAMVQDLIEKSNRQNLPIYVETSSDTNLHFYLQHGFENYHTSEEALFGFKLFFLRRLPATIQTDGNI